MLSFCMPFVCTYSFHTSHLHTFHSLLTLTSLSLKHPQSSSTFNKLHLLHGFLATICLQLLTTDGINETTSKFFSINHCNNWHCLHSHIRRTPYLVHRPFLFSLFSFSYSISILLFFTLMFFHFHRQLVFANF